MKKSVVYAGNRTVYPDMVTAAKSLLMHNKVDDVYFLIEDDKFPYYIPDVIKTINVKNQKWFPSDSPNIKTRFSYIVLMRAVLSEIFPDLDKILSLDIDTIVLGDITSLWELPLDNYYFAAVEEPTSRKGGTNKKDPIFYENQNEYYNVGVTLYNLKKLRDGTTMKGVKLLNERAWYSVEQDTFNIVCGGKILKIPSDYNVCNYWTAPTVNPLIAHFAGDPLDQWRKEIIVKYFERFSWEKIMEENSKLS